MTQSSTTPRKRALHDKTAGAHRSTLSEFASLVHQMVSGPMAQEDVVDEHARVDAPVRLHQRGGHRPRGVRGRAVAADWKEETE